MFRLSIEHFDRFLTHAILSFPSYIGCNCVCQQQFCNAGLSRTYTSMEKEKINVLRGFCLRVGLFTPIRGMGGGWGS
jgi:hypothetical protein